MDTPVKYQFVFDESHLLAAQARYRRQHSLLRYFSWLWYVAMAALLGYLAFLLYRGHFNLWPALIIFLPMAGVGSAATHASIRSKFRKSPFHNQTLDTELSDEGLQARTADSETRHAWKMMTKARSFRDGLLLFHGPHVFRWLPDATLVSGTREQVHSLVRSHVTDYVEVDSRST
jgi:hypothetical protein